MRCERRTSSLRYPTTMSANGSQGRAASTNDLGAVEIITYSDDSMYRSVQGIMPYAYACFMCIPSCTRVRYRSARIGVWFSLGFITLAVAANGSQRWFCLQRRLTELFPNQTSVSALGFYWTTSPCLCNVLETAGLRPELSPTTPTASTIGNVHVQLSPRNARPADTRSRRSTSRSCRRASARTH